MELTQKQLVIVTPNVGGDTLTAYTRAAGGDNLGKVTRGQVYWGLRQLSDRIELAVYKTDFPFQLTWGSVWVDKNYVSSYTETDPAVPSDEPTTGEVTWKTVLLAACQAVVDELKK